MNILQFMVESPLLTFFLVLLILCGLDEMVKTFVRHLNIRKHGWPPSHCDADGYFKPEPEHEDFNEDWKN